jgi:hypothetical protein
MQSLSFPDPTQVQRLTKVYYRVKLDKWFFAMYLGILSRQPLFEEELTGWSFVD